MFQYISCYSLSIRKSGTESKRETFQYISCYSLSLKTLAEQMLSNKFQYISCYSLSGIPHLRCRDGMEVSIHLMLLFIVHFQIRKMPSNYGFNTSHVTLYQKVLRYLYRLRKSFNTSHVTLYRIYDYVSSANLEVSIHLMLLFIREETSSTTKAKTVSIHLMLLFIKMTAENYIILGSFNTSHVTLYRWNMRLKNVV